MGVSVAVLTLTFSHEALASAACPPRRSTTPYCVSRSAAGLLWINRTSRRDEPFDRLNNGPGITLSDDWITVLWPAPRTVQFGGIVNVIVAV